MKHVRGRLGMVLVIGMLATAIGCAPLSRPITQREQNTAIGGLAGGALGALIGSFAGSAVAGGLFGIPLGAAAGFYVGDMMARDEASREARTDERDDEIARLRAENERLRRESDATSRR